MTIEIKKCCATCGLGAVFGLNYTCAARDISTQFSSVWACNNWCERPGLRKAITVVDDPLAAASSIDEITARQEKRMELKKQIEATIALAVIELDYVVNQLACNARWATRNCERLARQAAEYRAALSAGKYARPTWNGLGELQGTGVELDRLCGETMRLATSLDHLLRLGKNEKE